MIELTTYKTYSQDQLSAMGKVVYAGKANAWQLSKYNLVRSLLLEELRSLNPDAKDTGSAAYIHGAIWAALREQHDQEKEVAARMRANAQNAHNNLLNYDLEAKRKERATQHRVQPTGGNVRRIWEDTPGSDDPNIVVFKPTTSG